MAKGKNKNNRYKNRYRYRHRKNNSKKSVDIEKNTNNVIINETTQDENINTTELTDAIDKLFEESEVFARENNEPENITTIEKTSQSELEASEKKNNHDNYEDSPKEDISYVDNKNIDSDTGTEIVPFENTPVDELETDNKENNYDDFEKTSLDVFNIDKVEGEEENNFETANINNREEDDLYEVETNRDFSNDIETTSQNNNDVSDVFASRDEIDVENDKNVERLSVEEPKTSKNKMYISYNTRLIINLIAIFVFVVLAIALFVSSVTIKARSSILYRQTSNLDYKVFLKQNDYYNEPYLQKNMQYIASLIDNIDVTFNYNFNVNQNIDYKYTYYVQADVAVTSSEDKTKIIYSKTDKLTEPDTIIKDNSNGFNISQNIKINYAEYNDLVKAFKSSYAINADSNLVLSLLVEVEDEKGNKIKSFDKDAMKLTIPLTEQMIDISMDYNEINNSDNVNIYKDFNISNKLTLVLSIISLVVALVFITKLMIFLKKTSAKKTIYDVTLSKILREYDRVIVNSKKIVDLNEDVVDVNSFNELLDVRDNLEKPIIFSEVHKGQKSIFIVKTPNETYRYVLKLVDLQKEQEK